MSNYQAMDTISATEGTAFMTVNGRNFELFFIKSVEAKLKKNKKEVKVLGNRFVGHKVTSATGTGTLSIRECTSYFKEMMLNYVNDGQDVYFDLQISNEDKSSHRGRETKLLRGCNLDEMTIANLSIEDGILEQDMPFTFEGIELLETYVN